MMRTYASRNGLGSRRSSFDTARPTSSLQRACDCGARCPKCQTQGTAQDRDGSGPAVQAVLASPGQSLDPSVRTFMESRFDRDFSRVRVHADAEAASSTRAAHALAYTVGPHVVFGAGHYRPGTNDGMRLLAHELTHVVQQDAAEPGVPVATGLPAAGGAAEREAGCVAAHVAAGAAAPPVQGGHAPAMARFSDTGHHVIEEAGLEGAGFSSSQRETIERGNVQRDYSQVGKVGNAALLCKPQSFGGYRPVEHFDNYLWDVVKGGWRSRGGSAIGEKGIDVKETPIDYIAAELSVVAMSDKEGDLVHLGNALHTIEDFFAHSNFVELMQGDTSHGRELITGDPAGPSQSVSRILEAITPKGARERYHEESETAVATALPGSHTQLAHDDPTTKNYTIARRLAALVVQDLGSEVLAVMKAPRLERAALMKEQVVAKAERYLRPPHPNDKWWESLVASDAGTIDQRLREAELRTPITVNQCALSPLKNLEASRDSLMTIPFGVAIPTTIVGNQVWFQAGGGVTQPFPFEPLPGERSSEGAGLVVGAQITGRFDFP